LCTEHSRRFGGHTLRVDMTGGVMSGLRAAVVSNADNPIGKRRRCCSSRPLVVGSCAIAQRDRNTIIHPPAEGRAVVSKLASPTTSRCFELRDEFFGLELSGIGVVYADPPGRPDLRTVFGIYARSIYELQLRLRYGSTDTPNIVSRELPYRASCASISVHEGACQIRHDASPLPV